MITEFAKKILQQQRSQSREQKLSHYQSTVQQRHKRSSFFDNHSPELKKRDKASLSPPKATLPKGKMPLKSKKAGKGAGEN